jgi:hypothetical protein
LNLLPAFVSERQHISGRAGTPSLGIFQFFSFKIFRAELSSSLESVGSLFFTARDSIFFQTSSVTLPLVTTQYPRDHKCWPQ